MLPVHSYRYVFIAIQYTAFSNLRNVSGISDQSAGLQPEDHAIEPSPCLPIICCSSDVVSVSWVIIPTTYQALVRLGTQIHLFRRHSQQHYALTDRKPGILGRLWLWTQY